MAVRIRCRGITSGRTDDLVQTGLLRILEPLPRCQATHQDATHPVPILRQRIRFALHDAAYDTPLRVTKRLQRWHRALRVLDREPLPGERVGHYRWTPRAITLTRQLDDLHRGTHGDPREALDQVAQRGVTPLEELAHAERTTAVRAAVGQLAEPYRGTLTAALDGASAPGARRTPPSFAKIVWAHRGRWSQLRASLAAFAD